MTVFCAPGCSLSAEAQYKRKVAETGAPALHAVENARLRQLMGDMSQLREQSDYSRPLELQQDRDKCAQVAKSLAESASKLPAIAPELKLNEHEAATYLSLAAKLRQQALDFGNVAQRGTFHELNQSMDRMMTTCNACHSLFRGPRITGAAPAPQK
jgi:hypothetical protein